MTGIWIGTENGLVAVGDAPAGLDGLRVTALARGPDAPVALGGDGVWMASGETWERRAAVEGRARCLLRVDTGVLIGAAEARLLLASDDGISGIDEFDQVEGREEWYTPWGGPPDTRSITHDAEGTVYVNVHVGGIPRSRDGLKTWQPTIDIDADVHQVLAHPERAGHVVAACAWGLAESRDGGDTWAITDEGLHASYSRAVAIAGDTLLLTASTSHRGERAAIYRRPLDEPDHQPERCVRGLPDEWFRGNIDTYWLDARDGTAAFVSAAGDVFVSEDEGSTWEHAARVNDPLCLLLI